MIYTCVSLGSEGEQSTSSLVDVIPGSYVTCIYDSQWFIGNIVEVSDTNQDVYVEFMNLWQVIFVA